MKKIIALIFIFLFLSSNNACFATEFSRDLPVEGRIFVSTYLQKDSQFLELVFSYQPEQIAQRNYFQTIFDRYYRELVKDGWRKTIFENLKELAIAINLTYTENDKILGALIHELKTDQFTLIEDCSLLITSAIKEILIKKEE